MAATYQKADVGTIALLNLVQQKHHPRLILNDVRIGVLFAIAKVDDDGNKTGPAIKGYAGAPAGASVKNVSLKDRVVKDYDVEMLIDGDEWPHLPECVQVALLDHELTHIDPTGETDDLGRPKIKMREEDFIAWGFWEVIKRHGAAAMEHRALKRLEDKHGQLLLELPDLLKQEPLPVGGTVTISANGQEVGTMSGSEFSQIGQQVSQHLRTRGGKNKL